MSKLVVNILNMIVIMFFYLSESKQRAITMSLNISMFVKRHAVCKESTFPHKTFIFRILEWNTTFWEGFLYNLERISNCIQNHSKTVF